MGNQILVTFEITKFNLFLNLYNMKIIRLASIQIIIIVAAFFFTTSVNAQSSLPVAMNWVTFEQFPALNKANPRPLLVFMYKPGEDSSKLMLDNAFSKKEVCMYTNMRYYAVKFDITSKADVLFMDGKVYKKNPAKPFHDLATMLLGEKPIAPTVLLYDLQNDGFKFAGYKSHYDLLCELVYISENVQKTTRYDRWAPAYFHAFPPDKKNNVIPLAINWISLSEAISLNNQKPKGIFLTFYTKSNAASSVMLANAFSHNMVAQFMNNNFYCVRIDAQTTDTLTWDKPYYNSKQAGNFHDLAKKMMRDNMQFPSLFFIDENDKLILAEQSYLSPEALYVLSNYVVSQAYKSKDFTEYVKTFKFEFNDIVPRENENTEKP